MIRTVIMTINVTILKNSIVVKIQHKIILICSCYNSRVQTSTIHSYFKGSKFWNQKSDDLCSRYERTRDIDFYSVQLIHI